MKFPLQLVTPFRRDLHLVPEILTPNMSHGSDLSAYELVRLENIRKNNEFLAQLGLFPPVPKPKVKVEERVIQEKKKRTRLEREPSPVVRRRSSRLSGQFQPEDIVSLEDEVEMPTAVNDDIPFYDRIAQELLQLGHQKMQMKQQPAVHSPKVSHLAHQQGELQVRYGLQICLAEGLKLFPLKNRQNYKHKKQTSFATTPHR
eukprot:gene8694-10288_t